MKRNMAEKLTASVLAAVLTFGMMAPQTAMTAEAAAKSTLEKDVQKLVKKSKAKKEKTQKKQIFYEDGFLHEINVQKIKNDQSKFLRKGRTNEENKNTDRSSSSGTWRYRKQHFTGSSFHADGRSSHGKTGTCKSEKQVLLL